MSTKTHGQKIELFLPDADPNGRIICTFSNWGGKAFKIPRTKIKDSFDRAELLSTGVYFLFGKPESVTDKPMVYIGESENLTIRLGQHLASKDFWNEAVVFFGKENSLNKAHVKYLESRLFKIAGNAKRYEIKNDKTPTASSISEAEEAEMEGFIQYIHILLKVLGFNVLEALEIVSDTDKENLNFLYIKTTKGADAKGIMTPDGFLVFSGSSIANETVDSCPKSVVEKRDYMIQNKEITQENETLTLNANYLFSSPSTAASVIMGRSANGLSDWKNTEGKSLKQLEGKDETV